MCFSYVHLDGILWAFWPFYGCETFLVTICYFTVWHTYPPYCFVFHLSCHDVAVRGTWPSLADLKERRDVIGGAVVESIVIGHYLVLQEFQARIRHHLFGISLTSVALTCRLPLFILAACISLLRTYGVLFWTEWWNWRIWGLTTVHSSFRENDGNY